MTVKDLSAYEMRRLTLEVQGEALAACRGNHHRSEGCDFELITADEALALVYDLRDRYVRLRYALEKVKEAAGSHTIAVNDNHPAGWGFVHRTADEVLEAT